MTSYKLLGSSTEDINKPAVKYNKTKPPKRKAASFLRQIWLFGFRYVYIFLFWKYFANLIFAVILLLK
jgi:hypothetical protein